MKPSVSPRQLTAIGEWYRKGEEEEFVVGDQVECGMELSIPIIPICLWEAGREPLSRLMRAASATSRSIKRPSTISIQSTENGASGMTSTLRFLTCIRTISNPTWAKACQWNSPRTSRPSRLIADPEDRLRAALGVTTDDAVPLVEKATLLK